MLPFTHVAILVPKLESLYIRFSFILHTQHFPSGFKFAWSCSCMTNYWMKDLYPEWQTQELDWAPHINQSLLVNGFLQKRPKAPQNVSTSKATKTIDPQFYLLSCNQAITTSLSVSRLPNTRQNYWLTRFDASSFKEKTKKLIQLELCDYNHLLAECFYFQEEYVDKGDQVTLSHLIKLYLWRKQPHWHLMVTIEE